MAFTAGGFYFVVLAWCFFVLALKMTFVAFATGFARKKSGPPASPEDAKLTGSTYTTETPEAVKRWRRIHRNDMENIIPFALTFVAFTFALPGAKDFNYYIGAVLGIIFVLSRIAHTVSYALALQHWRSIAFFAGLLSTLVLGLYAGILSFVTR